MRVLIVGGTEFISLALVRTLLRQGHSVTVLNRGRKTDRLLPGVDLRVCDRKDHAALRSALAGTRFDGVYDVAYAPTTGEDVAALADAVLPAAPHVPFVSTGRVYDHALPIPYSGVSRSGRRRPGVAAVYRPSSLGRALAQADFAVVVLPLTAETRGLIGEAELRAMKPSAWLLNIGRGAVIEEGALLRALGDRWIAGAVLDVFHTEPLASDHPLWELPNVVITPHIAGPSVPGEIAPIFNENLRRYLAGRPLRFRVDRARVLKVRAINSSPVQRRRENEPTGHSRPLMNSSRETSLAGCGGIITPQIRRAYLSDLIVLEEAHGQDADSGLRW